MTDRSHRDAEYVVIRNSKSKKPTRYYYDADADDDNDSQAGEISRRISRTQPTKEQRIKYVISDEHESDYRRPRVVESKNHGIKIRTTTTGEQVVLDEDNNVIKIIRNNRTPSPPSLPTIIESPRRRIRPRESQTLFYETSDGHFTTRSSKNPSVVRRPKDDFVYAEDEPTKILRKIIIDPRTGAQETIYEKEKPKKQAQSKYVIRKSIPEEPVDSENEYEQQSQYVQVVQRRTVPKQEAPTSKYMMIRKKVDSEPVYTATSSIPASKNVRRIVYESSPKKTLPTYVYATNGKYYK